jgi:hypothetical protein
MKPTEEQIRVFVQATLQEWTLYAVSYLKASAKKRGVSITNETIDSISAKVLSSVASDMQGAVLSFLPSGRLKDMKVVTHTKPLPKEVIEQEIINWIQKIGLGKFQYVPGYRAGKVPAESIAVRRIAWGVGKGIVKGKWVRKAWYAKTMGSNIRTLTQKLITDYQTVIQTSLAQQISNK